MILHCPRCKEAIDLSDTELAAIHCPQCNEAIDISGLAERTCPVCCGEFEPGDELVVCPDCKIIYHTECWEENKGCATYGCASTHHLETHNSAGEGGNHADAFCPYCGVAHASTDLVCPSCGHVLRRDLVCGETMDRETADNAPKLVRNGRLLWKEVKAVFALAWKGMSQYADFRGKTPRNEYLAYMGVLCVIMSLLGILGNPWPVVVLGFLVLIPSLAITVRRLRDTDVSPWLIIVIPIIPLLVLVPTVNGQGDQEV